jgi:acetoacetyl-CoA reductase
VLAEFGTVDILVNNAGITRDSGFAKRTKEDWDKVLRTDLDSMFNMTKPRAAESQGESDAGRHRIDVCQSRRCIED